MRKLKISLLFLGLMLLLLVVPAAQASAPEKGSGTFDIARVISGVKITDDGNIKVNFTSTITYEGDIEGVSVVQAVAILHDDGTFNLLAHSGNFIGSINGREGTAIVKFAQVSGEGPAPDGCCYVGNVQFEGTGGDLENFKGRIDKLSFQAEGGKTYLSSAHFH
ncbi:MAG: hypothetical protein IH872_05860 [Chloroflexi bacterium]|nr:hypothetical protein [Chloroflexota bacterium]